MNNAPKTIAEQLDAAQSGEEFGRALASWMSALCVDTPTQNDVESST